MGSKQLHIIIFLLAMTVDVRVRAKPIEVPKKCTELYDQECAILAQSALEDFKTPSGMQVFITKNSSLVRKSANEITMVRGSARVSATDNVVIRNLYGELTLNGGVVIIEASDSLFKFTNLSAKLFYRPRGEKVSHELPVGYSTYFAYVTKSGVADTGFPHPAEIEQLIKSWGKLVYNSERKKFAEDLDKFLASWALVTQNVSDWYVDTVQREIASLRSEEERIARLKAAREAEDRKYRNMFRSRIFNEW